MHKDEDDADIISRLDDREKARTGLSLRTAQDVLAPDGASEQYPSGGHKMSCSLTKNRLSFYWSPR